MSVPGLIFALVLAIVVVAIIVAPLLRRPAPSADDSIVRQRERAVARYERALRNVRDLDEDFSLGKIDSAVYTTDRAVWIERGVQALKALDKLDAAPAPNSPDRPIAAMNDAELDAAVEAAVARARMRTP